MPMQFELTEEQQQVKRMVREFAEAEIKPHVMEWDESQHFPRELFTKMGELGLTGVIFPEQYGGAGWAMSSTSQSSKRSRASVVRLDYPSPRTIRFAPITIYQYASESHKQKYVTPLAKAKSLVRGD